MLGNLYIVATPIGNLGDMSNRAIEILKNVDMIAAEDTRNTGILLDHFDIHTKMTSNHKFNEHQTVDRLISELLAGKSIAVVSDAGTPCVNDPGFIVAESAAKAGINVIGIPGPCAAVTAISASGLDAASFAFRGFFPREKKEIRDEFDLVEHRGSDLYIYYESPKRIKDTISAICDRFPEAQLALCNDLTKIHERIYRGTPASVLSMLNDNPNAEKGEYCLLMQYKAPETNESEKDLLTPEAMLIDEIIKTGCTMKDAVASKAGTCKEYTKKEFYAASLRLKDMEL